MVEIWKDIHGYEGRYQVSNLGEVRSLPIKMIYKDNQTHYLVGKILKQTMTTTGYKKVELCNEQEKKSFKVHRLVALAFLVNTFNKPHINHKDGNPLNNVVDNLEWCTQKENMIHARKTGLTTYLQDTINHTCLIKDYLNSNCNHVCEKYKITKAILYDILSKHDIERHGNVKYSINLDEILKDIKSGMRNVDIAEKHKCSRKLINVRKHQFKKEGLL